MNTVLNRGGVWPRAMRVTLVAFFGLVLASRAWACGTCPACRLAKACDAGAPVEGWEVPQIMSDLGGSGSDALPIQPGSWTLAITPDTQHYSTNLNNRLEHFFNQTEWLADNRDSHNIKMVLHEGDITNNNNVTEWNNAKAALSVLDTGNVTYALAPGNHDYGPGGNSSNRDTLFHNNEYFGPTSAYANQSTIGGFFESGKTDNSWHTFNAGGNDWIVFTMEFGPRDEVIAWANDVMSQNSDKLGMLVTHAYMYYDETIYDWATKGTSQNWNPHSYGVANQPGQTVNDGQELWDNFVKLHENFRFVFNGHVLGDGTGYRATLGDNGNVVHQMLANYQMNDGGQGDMRLLEFLADGETVNVRTYSPSLDRYDTSPDQQFTVNMNALPPPPPVLHQAVAANLINTAATAPTDNNISTVQITHTGAPPVGTAQVNRGDYQITVNGQGLSHTKGIMLASISQHDRPDFVNRRATVEAGRNPFGDGYMSLALTEAGTGGVGEVNFNTSVAWFAFEGGWTGAHVNGDGSLAPTAFNGVTQGQVARTNTGRYTVDMGASAQSEGLLFAIGNNNDNIVVQTGLLAGGSSWDVRVQENSANFAATGQDQNWSFLYLPYTTQNLVGGLYDGSDNTHLSSVGDFTMTRLNTGQYQLAIDGQSPETGMLITTVTHETTFGGVTGPEDNILTYQPGPNGTFLINSYDLAALNFQNTAFSWAFVGFEDQLSLEPIAPLPELDFTLDRTTGQVLLTNVGEVDAEIVSVTMLSGGGALQSEHWKSITNFYDAAPQDGSVDPDHAWSIETATEFILSEFEPTEVGATLAADQEINFGESVWKKSRIEDVVLRVELADGTILLESVGYLNGPGGDSYHRSDLNTDGLITEGDWSFFFPNMLADLSQMTTVERALAGDLNGDGKNDVLDFGLFKADYDFFNGSGAFENMVAGVPEPSTLGLLLFAGLGAIVARRRWR